MKIECCEAFWEVFLFQQPLFSAFERLGRLKISSKTRADSGCFGSLASTRQEELEDEGYSLGHAQVAARMRFHGHLAHGMV